MCGITPATPVEFLVSFRFCIASVPELIRHHTCDLELMAPAVSLTLHCHTNAAVGGLRGVQPH
jgi:hypothetical protein